MREIEIYAAVNRPDETIAVWYILRVHNRTLDRVRKRLDELQADYYLPMCHDVVKEKGKRVKKLVPAIKDLVFLHASMQDIGRLRETENLPLSFYYSHCSHVQNDALWVREAEMREFIRAANAYDRHPRIQPFESASLRHGMRIRIVDGPLQGMEGDYIQLKRGEKRRLVLTLADVVTVNLELSAEDLIEIIDS